MTPMHLRLRICVQPRSPACSAPSSKPATFCCSSQQMNGQTDGHWTITQTAPQSACYVSSVKNTTKRVNTIICYHTTQQAMWKKSPLLVFALPYLLGSTFSDSSSLTLSCLEHWTASKVLRELYDKTKLQITALTLLEIYYGSHPLVSDS